MRLVFLLLFCIFNFWLFAQEKAEEMTPKSPPQTTVKSETILPHNIIYDFPDQEAEFPGGRDAMIQFITENIIYPVLSIENRDQGKVFLSFVINVDGSIEDVKIERGATAELNEEAMRIFRKMPNWKPGTKNGKVVRTRCRWPIIFVLSK